MRCVDRILRNQKYKSCLRCVDISPARHTNIWTFCFDMNVVQGHCFPRDMVAICRHMGHTVGLRPSQKNYREFVRLFFPVGRATQQTGLRHIYIGRVPSPFLFALCVHSVCLLCPFCPGCVHSGLYCVHSVCLLCPFCGNCVHSSLRAASGKIELYTKTLM